MKKRFLLMLLAALLLTSAIFAYSAAGETRRSTITIDREEYDRLQKYQKLDEVMQYIKSYYYKEPDADKMLDYAVQGMLAALGDPYTFYYDAKSVADM